MSNKVTISLADLQNKYLTGVHTVISDESVQNINTAGSVVRLIPGVSRIGWFNRPFLIEKGDITTARLLFGNRDKMLERKGSFFHRSIETALASGPVLALNLLSLNNEIGEDGLPSENADCAEYQSFSTDVAGINGDKRNKLYASYFSKERFYIPSSEYLLATRDDADKTQILSLVNLTQGKMSFIIKKASVRGFDMTAREWYGNEEIPAFIRPTDLMSDYFIEIIAIVGDYGKSKYSQLSVDPVFSQYFTPNGLIASKLDAFLNRNEVVVKQRMTGCLIPDFRSKDGSSLYIESLINANTLSTGIVCAVDREQIENYEYDTNESFVDLIGHRLLTENVSSISCLSYKQNILNDFTYKKINENKTQHLKKSEQLKLTYAKNKITVSIESGYEDFETIKSTLNLGQYFKGKTTANGKTAGITIDNPILQISRINKLNNSIIFDLTSPYKDAETADNDIFVDVDLEQTVPEVQAVGKVTVTAIDGGIDLAAETIIININDDKGVTKIAEAEINTTDKGAAIDKLVQSITTLASGYVGTKEGSDVLKITAKKGSGSSANGYTIEVSGGTKFKTSTSIFSGGTNGETSLTFEPKSDKFTLDGTNTYFLADKDSEVYKAWKNGILQNGDKLSSSSTTQYMSFSIENAINDLDLTNDAREMLKISLFTDADLVTKIEDGDAVNFGESQNSQGIGISGDNIVFISAIESLSSKMPILHQESSKIVVLDAKYNQDIKVGQYLYGYDEENNPMLSRILRIKKVKKDVESLTNDAISVECDNTIRIFNTPKGEKQIERYLPFTQIAETLEIFSLGGFTLKNSALPDGTNQKIKEIYSVMTDTNIAKALADPELIDFRYIVDTFNGGLEAKSKSYLTTLAKNRQRCLAILNCPTVKEFKNSTNPRFTSSPTPENPLPELDIDYIISGGNVDENPDWLYSLPDEDQGASFAGFFFPNIQVQNDDNTVSNVPPAVYVSNAFMRKFGTTDEFKPVAGTIRGLVTGEGVTGVDYPLLTEDYRKLIEFGINPIITKNNSLTIFGNETAYQKFTSVLNNIHVRDLLITLEAETERILTPYLFDYNDDTMRSTVSTLLRNYYNGLKNSYKAIESYELIFDRTNNPSWVIGMDAAIVDIVVQPTGCVKTFINRITLKGQNVNQSGFTVI